MLVAFWGSCNNRKQACCILPKSFSLQTGDVVFRRGGGFTSQVVVTADPHGNYSHVGIVVDSAGHKMIVHAVPGEPDFNGDVDRVKMDKPERFFSSMYATTGEVCRPKDKVVAVKAADFAFEQYHKHVLFDHDYDDHDTTKMYCTELVVYAFQNAGHDIIGKDRHSVNTPFLKAQCIFPSDIYLSPFLNSVIKFHK